MVMHAHLHTTRHSTAHTTRTLINTHAGTNITLCGDITFLSLFPQPWVTHAKKKTWRANQPEEIKKW